LFSITDILISSVTGSLLHFLNTQTTSTLYIIMFSKTSFVSALLALGAITSVSAHGAIVAVAGSNGIQGQAFGIVDTTPRDGTRRNPFQVRFHAHIVIIHVLITGLSDRHVYHP
jgi:hypothetical protein